MPYVRDDAASITGVGRTIALNRDFPQLEGRWHGIEVLGNRAIVKINTTVANLTLLAASYRRLPKDALNEPLSDLPALVRVTLRDDMLDMGYTTQEFNQRFPDGIGNYTLREALRFMATRRLKPRYDTETDTIVLDGEEVACESVDLVDLAVR